MSKPVVIRFVGDESRFRATTEAVGGRLRGFGKEAEDSGRRAGEGFDRAAEGADNAEGKAQGFASTLTGTKDVMDAAGEIARGNLFDGLVLAGQGAADLAEGLNYTVIPAVKAAAQAFTRQALATARDTAAKVANRAVTMALAVATRVMAAAQWALNVAMRANPIGIIITVITLLVAAIVIAYTRSQTFRNIVQGLWSALRRGVSVIGDVLGMLGRLGSAMFRFGADAVRSFIDGLLSMRDRVISAVSSIIPGPIKRFLNLGSPAEEGPLSVDGGPEAWGEKLARLYIRGLERGGARIGGPLVGLAGAGTPTLAGASGGPSITVHARTNADASEIAREVAWTMRTSGR